MSRSKRRPRDRAGRERMRSSFVISLILHALVLLALSIEWHSASRLHLPEKIYSVKVLWSTQARGSGGAEAKRDQVKVTAVKEAPTKKAARKEEAKTPVPKKPQKNKAKADSKTGAKNESESAPPAEKTAGAEAGEGAGSGTGIAVDAAQFPFSYFLSAIERKVSDNWYSAASEKGAGLTGVVYFRLMRNGSVEDVRIETSSGNGYFDRAAIRAVKSAAPFPPLPRGFQDDFLGVHFTFVQKK
jgi:TolA protein